MARFSLSLLAAVSAVAALPADPKAPPVDTSFLKRYAETRGFMLGRPTKPKITPDGKAVLFLRSEATVPKQSLFEFDVATGKTKELLPPETLLKGADENLSPEEKARRERQRVSVGGFADFHLDEPGTRVLVMLSGHLYVFDRATGKARELKTGPGTVVDPKWSPDGKYVSYVRDHDVYAYDLAADKELAVTTGGTAVKTHGLAEFVAQEEMGRFTGYWWSPDSKSIAYEEADHTGVEVWAVADPFRPDVKPREQFYPRPGHKNVSVRLGIKPVAGGETVWVEWDRKKFEYLAAVKWDKTGGLTIELQDRGQRFLGLCRVDPATGKLTTLTGDRDQAWVNIPPEAPRWVGGGFLWVATDHDRLEIQFRDPGGKLLATPVQAEDNVLELISADRGRSSPEIEVVYYSAPDPTQQQVRTKLFGSALDKAGHANREGVGAKPDGSEQYLYTNQPGYHTAIFSQQHNLYVVTSTTLSSLPRTTLLRMSGQDQFVLGDLPSVAEEPPFKPNVAVQKVGDYWTAVVRPRDFDPKKKYPVVVDVYGGPKHLTVVQAMRNWLVPQWLADQGFVVAAVDNRGTPGRGRDWERAVYQKFGTVPLEDQVKGLAALCDKYPELDRERVGIVGWSFGGYMAANAVLRRPDVFKAAVAGAPVTDWEDYDTHYTERYMGLLPESKAAYDEASLIPLAKNLSRPLLLVHGTADDNVYFRHTLKLSDALFRAGRDFEVLPLPGVTHMYTADPQATERLWAKTVTFFKKHLGEPK